MATQSVCGDGAILSSSLLSMFTHMT
ncbi:hypothetical protein CCACVL1_14986 [Corchorus capsularis]|uniref:Uncharacterized protein n=1 Tax=Corchorus capsularis TaxID=210143 RepID=A0A1R3I4J0_COCAP|nr:hypothetical protein CCACVL1_14986 [Corchorus capsularis]